MNGVRDDIISELRRAERKGRKFITSKEIAKTLGITPQRSGILISRMVDCPPYGMRLSVRTKGVWEISRAE
jgi:hypothetical protein